jgi:hypothetical protein
MFSDFFFASPTPQKIFTWPKEAIFVISAEKKSLLLYLIFLALFILMKRVALSRDYLIKHEVFCYMRSTLLLRRKKDVQVVLDIRRDWFSRNRLCIEYSVYQGPVNISEKFYILHQFLYTGRFFEMKIKI